MKRKTLSLVIAVCMFFVSVTVFAFAVEVPYVGYFQVILTEDSSRDIESTLQGFSHSAIEKIEVISADYSADSPQKTMIIVYIKHGENISALYEYLYSHWAVHSVLPDFAKIQENVRTENELQQKSYVKPYDINADGNVSAADARLALRAAVGLETLLNFAIRAANYGEIAPMTSFIARWILRTSVGLEHIPNFEINVVNFGEQFVIGPIECNGAAGFDIKLSGDTDKFTVEQKVFGDDTLSIGNSVRCYYIFTPKESGSFSLKFTYQDIKHAEPKVVDEFTVKINHVLEEESDWILY